MCVCVHVFLLFKTIKNYKTMINITTITGKSLKKYKKAASNNIKFTCTFFMYKANKYSEMRLNYKGPFLKVMGQFTFFLSNTIFNFSFRFNNNKRF